MKCCFPICLVAAGLLLCTPSFAQTRAHWVQLGANFGSFNDLEDVPISLDSLIGTAYFNSPFVLGGIAPGWAWSSNDRLFSSLSLEELNRSRRESVFITLKNKILPREAVERKDFRLRVRFGLEAHIHQNPEKRVWVFLSFGVNPYFHQAKVTPVWSEIFPSKVSRVGLGLDGKAGVLFALTDRVRCEASASALVSGLSFYRSRDKNPRLSAQSQDVRFTDFDFQGESWWWKIGVSYRLKDPDTSITN